jgi:hypothetical protein
LPALDAGISLGGKEDDRVKPGHDEKSKIWDIELRRLPEQDFPLGIAHGFLI